MAEEPAPNALGLEFSQGVPAEEQEAQTPVAESPASPRGADPNQKREKKNPYVNPDRVRTGGPQKEKLSEEELAEKMAKARQRNEEIRSRRAEVDKDAEVAKKAEAQDKARYAYNRKIQADVDATRESNAKRKMDRAGNREWDSVKTAPRGGGGGRSDSWKRNAPNRPEPEAQPTAAVDWASAPQEATNNWADDAPTNSAEAPADSAAQWASEGDSSEKPAADDNAATTNWAGETIPTANWGAAAVSDDASKEPQTDWAGTPIDNTSSWAAEGGETAVATDWAGNPIESTAGWGPPTETDDAPTNGPDSPSAERGGRGRGRGRGRGGDGERGGRGRGRGDGYRGRGRGRGEGDERGGRGRGGGGERGGRGRGEGRGRGRGGERGGRGGGTQGARSRGEAEGERTGEAL